ncbi:DUF4055 domain-containing protein [Rhodanobacter lindaniclasticus]|uniref:DUF4055 domain-containing protein n=1 Tax=Rhodanobacter lindaniclasticus TaxID=75310 RepID=UPI00109F749E|nr:DUF4055 domain-containing protein [Rhodanobacter lindaniclasticus]
MDYIKDDATGSGVTLIQQAQQAVSKAIGPGRYGLLVDYPPLEAPASKAAMVSGGAQATIALYPPKSITNWRTAKVGGKTILSLVVLAETHEQDDGFGLVSEPQFRVLSLKEGVYTVEIWRQGEKDWVVVESYIPKRGNGQPWREIPFTFGGAQDNEPGIGPMPMLDLATLNLAHYRNSADYEDSAYFIGQPQPWMSGLDETWRDHMEKSGIYLGSRAPWLLPVNGQAGIMQAAPNTLAKSAMDQKEQQMAQLGARMVQPGSAIKTATQQDSEDVTAHSVLSLACDNVSAAYTKALQWACDFMNVSGVASMSIPTEFVQAQLDANELGALLAAVQAGKLPESDFWAKLREVGLIDPEKDDDEIRAELESQGPALGELTPTEPNPPDPNADAGNQGEP